MAKNKKSIDEKIKEAFKVTRLRGRLERDAEISANFGFTLSGILIMLNYIEARAKVLLIQLNLVIIDSVKRAKGKVSINSFENYKQIEDVSLGKVIEEVKRYEFLEKKGVIEYLTEVNTIRKTYIHNLIEKSDEVKIGIRKRKVQEDFKRLQRALAFLEKISSQL